MLDKLKIAESDVALQSSLRKATLEEMDAHTAEKAELQEQPMAKRAELSELLSKNGELANELRRVKR